MGSRLALALAMSFAACGGSDGGGSDGGGGDGPDGSPADADADFTARAGQILVTETAYEAGQFDASVVAEFHDEPAGPFTTYFAEVERAGSCRLLELGATDGIEPPPYLSAGELAVSGAGDSLALQPGESGSYFALSMRPTSEVAVSAEGGAFGAFELTAGRPQTLVPEQISMDPPWEGFPPFNLEQEWTISWPDADPADRVHLIIEAEGGHADFAPVIAECDAADTGSLTIPAALAERLFAISNWNCGECNRPWLERYGRATGSSDQGRTVELRVSSRSRL